MNDDIDTAATEFSTALKADMRRERRLLYAELVLLALLLALAVLRYWVGR
ncbi:MULTISPECIES: hypothetical protein [unclassified Lysobacter]|nr:hypothetical protein [Lysobacter sp. MMG2]MBU8975859.1 hypothetical protein [Lysobacter sp. MMG2]